MPIIALTGNALMADRNKAIQVGMTDYLTKPFRQHQLLEIMAKYLLGFHPVGLVSGSKRDTRTSPRVHGVRRLATSQRHAQSATSS